MIVPPCTSPGSVNFIFNVLRLNGFILLLRDRFCFFIAYRRTLKERADVRPRGNAIYCLLAIGFTFLPLAY
jgi:hypothetical protein